jgi:hypothetical protein
VEPLTSISREKRQQWSDSDISDGQTIIGEVLGDKDAVAPSDADLAMIFENAYLSARFWRLASRALSGTSASQTRPVFRTIDMEACRGVLEDERTERYRTSNIDALIHVARSIGPEGQDKN